jgi:hypothetical protein
VVLAGRGAEREQPLLDPLEIERIEGHVALQGFERVDVVHRAR